MDGQVDVVVHEPIRAMRLGRHGLPGGAAHGEVGAEDRRVPERRTDEEEVRAEVEERARTAQTARCVHEPGETCHSAGIRVLGEHPFDVGDPVRPWNAVRIDARDDGTARLVVTA
jgi:hypothetical protein